MCLKTVVVKSMSKFHQPEPEYRTMLTIFREPILSCRPFEMKVIDWVYDQWLQFDQDQDNANGQLLSACSLVCKAWRNQVRMNFYKPITICDEKLPSLSGVLRRNGPLSSHITGITITRKSEVLPISPFAVIHQLPKLSYLSIDQLDLAREHRWLDRAPFFHSVRTLHLCFRQSCQLSQLIRFIDTFSCLSSLKLAFNYNNLEYNGGILCKPSYINTRFITSLKLDITPGVSRLIDWFLKARPLLACLKSAILYLSNLRCEPEFRSGCEGVRKILACCYASIEDLRLYVDVVPRMETAFDPAS